MNSYPSQANSRQASRLQNSRSTGLGSGNAGAGWAFGAPSSFGGLGAAPGLGQARPGQLSGFAQVMGGGSGQAPIDMRDFPSLGGAPQNNPNAGGWNSNALRQSAIQQQQQQTSMQPSAIQATNLLNSRAPSTAPSHQSLDTYDGSRSQQQPVDRGVGGGGNNTGDEFPPLGGLQSGGMMPQPNGFGSALGSPAESHAHLNGHQSQLPIRDGSAFSPSQQSQISTGKPPTVDATMSSSSATQPGVKKWADLTEQERYGMAGLAARSQAQFNYSHGLPVDETLPTVELNAALLLGQDLDTIGMNLDSPEPIHPTFHPFPNPDSSNTIFDIRDRQPVPAFTLSDSYTVSNVPPLHTRMTSFSDETLLQIFYQYPQSLEQELAAAELSAREWRWHKVLRQWLQKDTREANAPGTAIPLVDHTNGLPVGTTPMRIGDRTERAVYIFLDAQNWRRERREFTLDYDALDSRVPSNGAPGLIHGVGPGNGVGQGVWSGGRGEPGQTQQGGGNVGAAGAPGAGA